MPEEKSKKNKNLVFYISAAISLFIVMAGALDGNSFSQVTSFLLSFVSEKFAWLYLIVMLLFVVFCLGIAFSRFGSIRLGPDDLKPQYSTISWFAMLFCAGMGVGLVFWGISEPLSHYVSPAAGIEPGTPEAAEFSIRSCLMHWGVHPWAAYGVVGLGLAYFQFRKGRPGLISSLFEPMLGEKGTRGPIGKTIDIFSVIVTIAGVAASLGMGALQICGGLNYLWGMPNNATVWLIVIVVICFIYLLSATSGLDKGVKLLSNFNLCLAGIFLVVAFISGPSIQILEILTTGVGDYISHFITDSLGLAPFGDDSWILSWRVFYWAWWIAWAPFCGQFCARVSKGRTIRQYLLTVSVLPAFFSFIWLGIYGGAAFNMNEISGGAILEAVNADYTTGLFALLGELPLYVITAPLALLLIVFSFLGSANSATFVLSMLTDHGNMDPDKKLRAGWGIAQGAVTIICIIVGGTSVLKILQTTSIVAAFPYMIIMILMCVSIYKTLAKDAAEEGLTKK